MEKCKGYQKKRRRPRWIFWLDLTFHLVHPSTGCLQFKGGKEIIHIIKAAKISNKRPKSHSSALFSSNMASSTAYRCKKPPL
ncbi:hypothetical protein BDV38DRAFT_246634 [Aspergillus pseudotamarii]|uniref:Uncharacterized protein n=1 Tax=Aspergillus pseudotamarii TaxID=132259 RepID=A0A5N6SSJ7_ASPPS|nr:uncharacterized protein BDV38DRAFT_246634 [Aspergillus pseudotamarii]KAE8137656.1 hypothetical protein BDV38DRAFT_246634 [Aspergillus pseudotamarii]